MTYIEKLQFTWIHTLTHSYHIPITVGPRRQAEKGQHPWQQRWDVHSVLCTRHDRALHHHHQVWRRRDSLLTLSYPCPAHWRRQQVSGHRSVRGLHVNVYLYPYCMYLWRKEGLDNHCSDEVALVGFSPWCHVNEAPFTFYLQFPLEDMDWVSIS